MSASPDQASPAFTPRAFALVVAKVMLACAVLLVVLVTFISTTQGPGVITRATLAPAGYLTFLLGWAVAYTQFFKFPERQRVLLLGVAVGGILLATTSLIAPSSPSADPRMNPLGLVGGFVGCAFQLYALVVVLWFVPFLRPRI